MGFFDFLKSVPVVSQTISLGQAIAGDTKGARETQEQFASTVPIVSQVYSAGQAIAGDTRGAKATQERFLNNAIQVVVQGGPVGIALKDLVDNTIPGAPKLPTSTSLTPRADWMAAPGVQALCLHELLIPGTHDSTTYQFKDFVPDVVGKWAKAQTLTIQQQLEGGIRYLDIRVTKSGGDFYGTHKYPTVRLDDVYRAVKDFLVAHPHEKVIINTAWEGDGDGELDASKASLADVHFSGRYVRPASLLRPIGTWGPSESVIFLKNRKLFGAEDLGEFLHNSWNGDGNTETTDPATNSTKCLAWAKAHLRNTAQLNLLSFQITPSGGSIAGSAVADLIPIGAIVEAASGGRIESLEASAGRSNYLIANDLLKSAEAMKNTNIVAMDFANDAVIDGIVGLNPKTLEDAGYQSVSEDTVVELQQSSFVAFGAGNRLKFGVVAPAAVAFGNNTFGDPWFGVQKWGYYKDTPVHLQDNWRWCSSCNSMFFGGRNAGRGKCAGNAEGHANVGSGNYLVYHDCPNLAGRQHPWRFCSKCSSLVWGEVDGVCAAGGAHSHVSYDYYLPHVPDRQAVPDRGQDQWRYCSKCAALVYAGFSNAGACPAGGTHNSAGSWNYRIEIL